MDNSDEELEQLWQSQVALELMASFIHDLRSLAHTAAMRIELLRPVLRTDKEGSRLLDDLDHDLHRLMNMINGIRYASPEARNNREEHDLKRLCMNATKALETRLGHRKASIHWEGDDSLKVTASASSVHASVIHILMNSVEASYNAKHRALEIVMSGTTTADSVVLTIRDNGAGCPVLPTLDTDVSHQSPGDVLLERGVTTKPHRSGFGLYVVRRLIEADGGSCHVVEWTNGFAVQLRLPRGVKVGS